MRRNLRETIRHDYDYRCAYCGVSEVNLGAKLTIDHFMPNVQGGDDSNENLVYSCHACNEFKGEYWQIEPELQLINPRKEHIGEHIQELQDGMLLPLTERGGNHIAVLQLNRLELIAHRLEQREILEIRQRCRNLENYIAELEQVEETNQVNIRQLFGDSDI